MDADKELEIEVKFRIEDPAKIVGKLKVLGARRVDSGLERNIQFDKDGEIEKSHKLLRLRKYAGKADITFKKSVSNEKFNVRQENIVFIDSFDRGRKLLQALGFTESRKYEKKRQTWELGDIGILVDEMPFLGNFIEIEATEEQIVEMAGKLGLDMRDAITKCYRTLFIEYCRKQGIKKLDLVFGDQGNGDKRQGKGRGAPG